MSKADTDPALGAHRQQETRGHAGGPCAVNVQKEGFVSHRIGPSQRFPKEVKFSSHVLGANGKMNSVSISR